MEAETTLERLHRQRQACVERIGRVATEMAAAHRAQDFNIALLLDINDRIRQAEALDEPSS